MMNKKIIFLIAVSMILTAGCEFGPKEERPITDVDIRKGTDGLAMEFIQNAPPEKVFEETPFPIVVNLKNKGASDIEKGILVFSFEKAYVNIAGEGETCTEDKIEKCEDGTTIMIGHCEEGVLKGTGEICKIKIEGKSISNPAGDEEFITINAQTKEIGKQSETHPSTILATACYPYNTTFGSSVCVDTDIYGMRKGKKACEIKDLAFAEGQGAPVAVTKIETRMLPDVDQNKVKPHFIIYIENKGNGEVVDLSQVERACSSRPLEYQDFNNITINASLSGVPLRCSEKEDGPTKIRLREKKDMVRCTLEEGIDTGKDAYTAPLSVELEYGYTFTISKNIIIEKILKY